MCSRWWYSAASLALLATAGNVAIAGSLVAQQPTPPAAQPRSDPPFDFWFPPSPVPKPAPRQVPLAFTGVTVVDVTDGRLRPKQTVVVEGNRIRRIGPVGTVRVPPGATIVKAAGKYLIPGLWDMHAHIDTRVGFYPAILANGVTGVREMAQRFQHGTDSFRVWQREVMEGKRIGPRSYGPSADVTNAAPLMIDSTPPIIKTPADAPRIIDSLKAAGMRFLKYHGDGDLNLYFAILREARRVGLPVVGHLPGYSYLSSDSVTPMASAASDSGQVSIEHRDNLRPCWPEPLNVAAPDFAAIAAQCKPVIATLVRNGTWYTPTLMFYVGSKDNVAFDQKFLHLIHTLGMRRFLAGSDNMVMTPAGDVYAGQTLLQEVILLAGALTPLEALQAATLNPAKSFHATDSLGTVSPGKLADLVLLDGNPLTDIRNILRIRAVVANGRYFDGPMLDTLHSTGRARLRALAQDTASGLPSWVASPVIPMP